MPTHSPEEEVIGEGGEAPEHVDRSTADSRKQGDIEIVEVHGDELQDAWVIEEDRVVRYHCVPRCLLFPFDENVIQFLLNFCFQRGCQISSPMGNQLS